MKIPQCNTTCVKREDGLFCPYCKGKIVKNGRTKTSIQRFRCRNCSKQFQENYKNNAYLECINTQIIKLIKEGVGIRGIARLLAISTTTVLKRIVSISKALPKPRISFGKTYEVDEIRTFVKHKKCLIWIVYALQKDTKQVVDFTVGRRTNKTLKKVVETLLLSNTKRIFTDKLPNYRFIIPDEIHNTKFRGTNHIERMNLSLRTHLKRLNRRTICFSKSVIMLIACLKIYFW